MTQMKSKANAYIQSHKADFFSDQTSPSVGNPRGDVTLVEFLTTSVDTANRWHPP